VVGKATAAIFHVVNEVVKRSQENEELGELVEPGFESCQIADTHEWTYLRKDGTTFPILLSITAIKNSAGEITGYLGINIFQDKEAETETAVIFLDESQRIAKIGSWIYVQMIWFGQRTLYYFLNG
jgi:hypothetical protein